MRTTALIPVALTVWLLAPCSLQAQGRIERDILGGIGLVGQSTGANLEIGARGDESAAALVAGAFRWFVTRQLGLGGEVGLLVPFSGDRELSVNATVRLRRYGQQAGLLPYISGGYTNTIYNGANIGFGFRDRTTPRAFFAEARDFFWDNHHGATEHVIMFRIGMTFDN